MSTYWYMECTGHAPPLRSSDEFTQHTESAAFWTGIALIRQRPVREGFGEYFERNARNFLADHPDCVIELVSENGERRDGDGSNPRWETKPEQTAVDIAVEAVESAAAWLESCRDETWNGSERRPSNYQRAADDIRRYAAKLREGAS